MEDAVVPEPAQADTPPERPSVRPHRRRFVFIYGLLAAVFVFGLVGTVLWAGRAINPPPAWSAWKPSGGGLGAAKQIASHVAGTYHLQSGKQLVDVIAKSPSVAAGNQQIPIQFIALTGKKGVIDADFPVDPSNSLVYSLCGLGASCSIATGTPSVARGTLVQREILELALYTFKYVGGIDHVVAFMPPKPGSPPTAAIYLQKGDLSQQLKLPLARTLSPKVPLASTIAIGEQKTILATTNARIYQFSLSQAQTGDAILVLKPAA